MTATFLAIFFTVSTTELTYRLLPGPLDTTTPSGSTDKISSFVALYGITTMLHPLLFNSLISPYFTPKSNKTILYSPFGIVYDLVVDTYFTPFVTLEVFLSAATTFSTSSSSSAKVAFITPLSLIFLVIALVSTPLIPGISFNFIYSSKLIFPLKLL